MITVQFLFRMKVQPFLFHLNNYFAIPVRSIEAFECARRWLAGARHTVRQQTHSGTKAFYRLC